jgi:hypothetical protein
MDGLLITGITNEAFLLHLKEVAKEAVKEAVKETKTEDLLTQEEASTSLDISKTTIIKWGKKGIVTPIDKGGRVYYDRKEIMSRNKKG